MGKRKDVGSVSGVGLVKKAKKYYDKISNHVDGYLNSDKKCTGENCTCGEDMLAMLIALRVATTMTKKRIEDVAEVPQDLWQHADELTAYAVRYETSKSPTTSKTTREAVEVFAKLLLDVLTVVGNNDTDDVEPEKKGLDTTDHNVN